MERFDPSRFDDVFVEVRANDDRQAGKHDMEKEVGLFPAPFPDEDIIGFATFTSFMSAGTSEAERSSLTRR